MTKPRFTVGSVTDYPISRKGIQGRRWATIWYVHDSAYGYQIHSRFHGSSAEQRAHQVAALLNNPPTALHAGGKTHCIHGHPFDPVNTYIDTKGKRRCRACKAAESRARRAR